MLHVYICICRRRQHLLPVPSMSMERWICGATPQQTSSASTSPCLCFLGGARCGDLRRVCVCICCGVSKQRMGRVCFLGRVHMVGNEQTELPTDVLMSHLHFDGNRVHHKAGTTMRVQQVMPLQRKLTSHPPTQNQVPLCHFYASHNLQQDPTK